MSQLAGAAVGGAIGGGVGALMGGLSGKRASSEKVQRIVLRLRVNDVKSPLHEVELLDRPTSWTKDVARKSADLARHWAAVFEVVIVQADREANAQGSGPESAFEALASTPASSWSPSVADELRKLAELRDEGSLTQEEFQELKRRLLKRSAA